MNGNIHDQNHDDQGEGQGQEEDQGEDQLHPLHHQHPLHRQQQTPLELRMRDPQEAEIASLALELAKVYRGAVDYIRQEHNLEPAEANARAEEMLRSVGTPEEIGSNGEEDDALIVPPAALAPWFEFARLAEVDPAKVIERWREICQGALDELVSGHRAAMSIFIPDEDGPLARARFLVLRAIFMEGWPPRGGIEQALIDMMAQAQTLYEHWLEVLVREKATSTEHRSSRYSSSGIPQPPRVSDVEAVEHAARMVDRFHKLFMRTLRQLRDLRRYTPPVTIQNAGQVNIGSQQVNLASTEQPPE